MKRKALEALPKINLEHEPVIIPMPKAEGGEK
jgi:hypothetical protein